MLQDASLNLLVQNLVIDRRNPKHQDREAAYCSSNLLCTSTSQSRNQYHQLDSLSEKVQAPHLKAPNLFKPLFFIPHPWIYSTEEKMSSTSAAE